MGLDGVMIAGIICWFPQGGGCIVQYLYNENINIVRILCSFGQIYVDYKKGGLFFIIKVFQLYEM